ncbi:MAG: EAL domain-containing protein, partial [Symploca sp. SIO1B1]|nr:EAL domain-containing protein [Symploca sp. SIO1B1]
ISEATNIADAIHQALSSPFYLENSEVFISASIGIALNTTNEPSMILTESNGNSTTSFSPTRIDCVLQPEELLRHADIAMYRAKGQGHTHYELYDTAMQRNSAYRLQLETDLRRGIEREEFQVYYQSIVSLETGKITGFEALLRWRHPQRGIVSPGEFIPIAEETGLITPISWWTLREACRQMSIWQKQFPTTQPLTINVNLSCQQFTEPDLIDKIDQILQETELMVGSLKLEITESVVMENPDWVKDVLLQLRQRKIFLCIDDFGTGYSSLSRLHNFPISTLKIDRSFVSRIGALGENLEIVQTIVNLAQTLGMDVVAEGIEVQEQVNPLIELRCEYGQGYLFSKPLDSEAAEGLLKNNK